MTGPTETTIREGSVESAGLRLHFLSMGNPSLPAVVFLHGAGLSGHTWKRVMRELCEDFYCVAPDLRGHGDSDWHSEGDYDLESHTKDTTTLAQRLGMGSFVLVGMSLGGAIALMTAAEHPAVALGLVMVDTGPGGTRDAARQRLDGMMHGHQEYESIDQAVDRALEANPTVSREALARRLELNMRQNSSGQWTWKWDPRIRWRNTPMTDAEQQRYAEERNRKLWDAALSVACPTLIIRGEKSEMFLEEDAVRTVQGFRTARSVTIPSAGHYVQRDQPLELASTLREYIGTDLSHVRFK